MTTLPRPLPRSLDPLPDESIIGYVLRLAHRLNLSPARLVEITGLNARQRTASIPGLSLAVHAAPDARAAFAHATRLSPGETDALFLSAFADRYPAAHPRGGPNRWGNPATLFDRWLFTRSTRYCPQCLAAGPGRVGSELGGPWRRTWRLPVVFACTRHRRYLDHLCPACQQPALQYSPPGQPRWRTTALHPTQCRIILRRDGAAQRTACAARLAADIAPTIPVSAAMLKLQRRLLSALNYERPSQIRELGQEVAVRHYFTDLQLLTYLIRVSWPHGRDLVPTADLAADLDAHLSDPTEHRHAMNGSRDQIARETPPLEASVCAALLATADSLLGLGSPRELSTELRRLFAHDDRRPGNAAWSWIFRTDRPDCSEGMRQAVTSALQTDVREQHFGSAGGR
ncbi:TniQ family protein [Amycolatopsis samaneae]|uniref:TniQ family protein n=1 Tax=Amycolatopsis samaneae TaxID=664691 RepID=A0ABW5GMX1_9PSEU